MTHTWTNTTARLIHTQTYEHMVYVRPHLQYCSSAWSPYSVADKELLESVQKRAVKMITNLSGTYEEKLRKLGLQTLEENRIRGDMVEMYKLLTVKTNVDFRQFFTLATPRLGAGNTRGNTGYLNVEEPSFAKGDVRRFFFTQRCPRVWNALPDSVKKSATVNSFKAAYDNFKKTS